MKKAAATLGLLAATAACLVHAKEPIQSGAMVLKSLEKFASGLNDKTKRSLEPDIAITMGYVIGMIDSDGSVCFDQKVSMAQVMLSIRDYLKAHPELMDRSGVVGVSGALRESYACQVKQR